MEACSIADQEDLIKRSLFSFVKSHIPSADIDDIILSYVVGILEDIATSPEGYDGFDVKEFSDMLTGYIPEFVNMKHELVSEWILKLSNLLSQGKAKAAEDNTEKATLAFSQLNLSSSLSSSGRSHQSSSECSNSDANSDGAGKKRNHLLSETSDAGSDSSGEYSNNDDTFVSLELQLLQEMFPTSSNLEIRHCLAVAAGDVERAAQIVLHRQEAGQSIVNSNPLSTHQRQRRAVNDDELKSRIIERYSYVDRSEDVREHRPVAPKAEPKKLVRYRDNKIVSLKGERYTEVRRDDGDDTAKVLKPAKNKAH